MIKTIDEENLQSVSANQSIKTDCDENIEHSSLFNKSDYEKIDRVEDEQVYATDILKENFHNALKLSDSSKSNKNCHLNSVTVSNVDFPNITKFNSDEKYSRYASHTCARESEDVSLSIGKCSREWKHYSNSILLAMSLPNLKSSLELLRSKIEDVSTELVFLLQERQRLQDEVDLRNIAIGQLLKVPEKLQWRTNEPLAIQMSVIFPPDENEALNCN